MAAHRRRPSASPHPTPPSNGSPARRNHVRLAAVFSSSVQASSSLELPPPRFHGLIDQAARTATPAPSSSSSPTPNPHPRRCHVVSWLRTLAGTPPPPAPARTLNCTFSPAPVRARTSSSTTPAEGAPPCRPHWSRGCAADTRHRVGRSKLGGVMARGSGQDRSKAEGRHGLRRHITSEARKKDGRGAVQWELAGLDVKSSNCSTGDGIKIIVGKTPRQIEISRRSLEAWSAKIKQVMMEVFSRRQEWAPVNRGIACV
ncbi:hypothetical protein BRADI_3g07242v3 [Brachypodium distachyon]|uniref:Uncharacterized protein n=1 Tax=Brachypodium distachyon TaxID=15368 RepID=A0A2K2CVQ3_BRADI|nr:hypothetical protein BRADI_3g07242v3 [Brachypodium distachyon]